MKYLTLGSIGWVVFIAASYVGKPVACHEQVYTWTLPFILFAFMALPSLLAYFAGKADAMDDFNEGKF